MKLSTTVSVGFGLIMILVLVSGSIAILTTDILSDRLYGKKRVFFVILLLAYSVYRGFRIYSLYKQNRREEQES